VVLVEIKLSSYVPTFALSSQRLNFYIKFNELFEGWFAGEIG